MRHLLCGFASRHERLIVNLHPERTFASEKRRGEIVAEKEGTYENQQSAHTHASGKSREASGEDVEILICP